MTNRPSFDGSVFLRCTHTHTHTVSLRSPPGTGSVDDPLPMLPSGASCDGDEASLLGHREIGDGVDLPVRRRAHRWHHERSRAARHSPDE
jgi:hypothetical protein